MLAASFILGMTALSVGDAFAQASSPSEIVGVWEAENGNLKFEMFDAGGSYAARMIYGNRLVEADGKTFKKDSLNPDPQLRGRSLEGIIFLNNLKWNAGNRHWEGGSFYDGSSGRTYSGRASLVNGKLELRGYLGTPLLGQTVVLRRAQ
jgi:uncharacterized protein (DUF2147 family)